jgi:NAD+ kinase
VSRSVKRVLCHANRSDPVSREAARGLAADLARGGFEVKEDLEAFAAHRPEILIVLGGDGFLMETLRVLEYPAAHVFGINFGTVGFLMNPKDCLPALVPMIKEWRFQEEDHAVLEGKLVLEDGREETVLAFNDFVIERMTRQSVRFQVYLDDLPFNRFAGDGLVLSTAAGSTAYNLAAGGPVLHPSIQGILVTPLYPHRASPFHSLQFSLVVPLASRLRILNDDVSKRSMRVVADGRQVERVARVEVADSGRRLALLRPETHVFVEKLARKFIGGQ